MGKLKIENNLGKIESKKKCSFVVGICNNTFHRGLTVNSLN